MPGFGPAAEFVAWRVPKGTTVALSKDSSQACVTMRASGPEASQQASEIWKDDFC